VSRWQSSRFRCQCTLVAKYQSTTESTATCIAVAHRRWLPSDRNKERHFSEDKLYFRTCLPSVELNEAPAFNRRWECESSVEGAWYGIGVGRVGQVVQCHFVVGRDVGLWLLWRQSKPGAFLTFICLRTTTLSYDVAHRTVRS
jgi:hypothetical protein